MSKVIQLDDHYIVADKITMFTVLYDIKMREVDFCIHFIGDDEPLAITVDEQNEKEITEKLIKAIEG